MRERALALESFLLTSHNLIASAAICSAMTFSSHHISRADATQRTTKNRRLRSPHVALIVDWLPVSGNATRCEGAAPWPHISAIGGTHGHRKSEWTAAHVRRRCVDAAAVVPAR